jgi:hypothetical protein
LPRHNVTTSCGRSLCPSRAISSGRNRVRHVASHFPHSQVNPQFVVVVKQTPRTAAG